MTQEDKELLLKDLCARVPYNTHIFTNSKHHIRLLTISHDIDYDGQFLINGLYDVDEVKPYLRPLSSMTEEEKDELRKLSTLLSSILLADKLSEWLNSHHFDYHGLIEKEFAIEVTEENNPYKDE